MNETAISSPQSRRLLKSCCLAVVFGLAAAAQAQTYVTNYINFAAFAGQRQIGLDSNNQAQQDAIGFPAGITANWGWEFQLMNDSPPPSGSENFTCRSGSVLTFSRPVIIWSMAAMRMQWGDTLEIVGKKNGLQVWRFNNPGQTWQWQTVTNGANLPIDELDFSGESWNTRYTDIYLSDAAGAPVPLLGAFGVSPSPLLLVAGSLVNLTWEVDPAAESVTLDQGIGEVLGYTDFGTGKGSYSVLPTATTTYTLTVIKGAKTNSAQVAVTVNVPGQTGFLSFEDLPAQEGPIPADYHWNVPEGVNIGWHGFYVKPTSFGTPSTPNVIYPPAWTLADGTNNAMIDFTSALDGTPLPVVVNCFALFKFPDSWNYGPVYIEGRLGGVVQWSFTNNEAADWENLVTKGANLPVDQVAFQGKWHYYDNFSISLTNAPATPITLSPALAQDGQFQFSWWNPVSNWPYYLVFKKDTLADGWYRVGGLRASLGATNSYSETANAPGFYRVMRYP